MSAPALRLADLDPHRRELVKRLLREKRLDPAELPIRPRRSGRPAGSEREAAEPLPLAPAQERLWILDRVDGASGVYSEPYLARIEGSLDPTALAAALAATVRRHEALRTTFPERGGRPVQEVGEPFAPPLPWLELGALPDARREGEMRRLVAREAARPFDLAKGPLLRAALVRLGGGDDRLFLNLHHIVCDARSLRIVFAELERLHDAARDGRPPEPAPPPVQYGDFTLWQRRWLAGGVLDRQLGYWRDRLAGVPTVLDLPADRPRRPESAEAPGAAAGGQVRFVLPPAVAAGVRALARGEGSTLFMVLLAAFFALLHRLSGQERVLAGSPVANRRRPELEDAVGMFVNTVVLDGDLRGDPTFRELVARARAAALAAFDHQDVPFARLVDELRPERAAGRPPLVQVFFLLQRSGRGEGGAAGDGEGGGDGLRLLPERIDNRTAKFDLTLVADDTGDGVSGHLDYDAGRFTPTAAARMLAAWRELVAGAVADPDARVSALPVLPAAERQRLLREGRGEPLPVPAGATLHGLFEARAAADPGAPALRFEGRSISYGELDRRAEGVARRLRALGVGRPGREWAVALVAERSPGAVAAILGVLKAGAAYVPIAPDLPAERRALLLRETEAAALLVPAGWTAGPGEAEEPGDLPGSAVGSTGDARFAGPVLGFDDEGDGAGEAEGPPLAIRSRAPGTGGGRLAYTIFTSGSTGTPKGVMVSHENAVHLALALRRAFGLTAGDRLLMVPALSFDASVGDLFPAFAAGASVVLHPDPSALSGADLTRLCAESAATVIDIPAALWQGWLQVLTAREAAEATVGAGGPVPPPVLPKTLRLAISGGESVGIDQVAAWEVLSGGRAAFLGPYGPTEATVCTTVFRTGPGWRRAVSSGRLPIGRPVANAAVYLLDRRGRPVPAGFLGEVAIGGAGVARGYLGRPAATAERFVPDPFGGEEGGRLYLTGDLARRLPGGDLEFAGRRDGQIKLRGYRIEPGEIESQLLRHPAVREAAVVVREDEPGRRRLVGYVVAQPGAAPAPEAADLKGFLAERLPAYMVPGRLVVLDALPLTAHGKVDRRALPAPPAEPARAGAAGAAPRGEVERTLAAIWARTLRVDRVAADDNFFDLGGDSILALQIVARAHEAGLKLAPKQLFQHQTVATLAAVAEPVPLPGEPGGPVTGAEEGEVTGEVEPTPIQRWFFAQAPADPHHWNQTVLVELAGDDGGGAAAAGAEEPGPWRRAVAHLVVRHDALRLRVEGFGDSDPGGPRLVVAPVAAMAETEAFAAVDLAALPAGRRRGALEGAAAGVQRSLDLARGPLFRAVLFGLGAGGAGAGERPRLLLVAHHLAVDGISWRILLEDLGTAWRRLRRGEPVRPPAKTASIRTWGERLAALARSPELAAERDLWAGELGTGWPRRPVRPLPRDLAPAPETGTVGSAATVSAALDADETEALLREAPRSYRATALDLLLAALAVAFHRWTGERALAVLVEGHGREEVALAGSGAGLPDAREIDLSRTVGWLTAAYPLRLEVALDGDRVDPGETLKAVKERLRRVPRGGLGWGLLRWGPGEPVTELKEAPEPEVVFNYLGRFDSSVAEGALFRPAAEDKGPERSPRGRRPHLLEIDAAVGGGRLRTAWTFSTRCHRRATVEALAAGWLAALRELLDPDRAEAGAGSTPSDFPLARLSQAGLDRLLGRLKAS